MPTENDEPDSGSAEELLLQPDKLATDLSESEDPNSYPLEGVFMRATARKREPHPHVDDPANDGADAHVVVNIKGTLGQRNIRLPYRQTWFTGCQREYIIRAVAIRATHHGQTQVYGYYTSSSGMAFELRRWVGDDEEFGGVKADPVLDEWAAQNFDGVVWVNDNVAVRSGGDS